MLNSARPRQIPVQPCCIPLCSLLVNYQLRLPTHGKQWTWLIILYITLKVTKSFTISLGTSLQVKTHCQPPESLLPHKFLTLQQLSTHPPIHHIPVGGITTTGGQLLPDSAALRSTYQHTEDPTALGIESWGKLSVLHFFQEKTLKPWRTNYKWNKSLYLHPSNLTLGCYSKRPKRRT